MHPARYKIRDQVQQLDPIKDCHQIIFTSGAYDFPWLGMRSLEFALFRTYAIPSISKLLDETGQFERYGQKRYDDTSLIIAEIVENGYDSERGRTAIKRMNQIHRRFEISNDDFLYVLSTFIYEPVRWNARYGWRKLTDIEKQASFNFWSQVGERMNINDIPSTYEAYEALNSDYERENFRHTDSNGRVGEATIQVFLHWYPAPLRGVVRKVIYAMLDDPLREAFGFPKPHHSVKWLAESGLKLRAFLLRNIFPPRKKAWRFTEAHNRSYPTGYDIPELGPTD
jgi:hypothetical protein